MTQWLHGCIWGLALPKGRTKIKRPAGRFHLAQAGLWQPFLAYFFLAGFLAFGAAFGLQAIVKPLFLEFGFRGISPDTIYLCCAPRVKWFCSAEPFLPGRKNPAVLKIKRGHLFG
jgi:hypothetical protein